MRWAAIHERIVNIGTQNSHAVHGQAELYRVD
jgi:hypothetical protein